MLGLELAHQVEDGTVNVALKLPEASDVGAGGVHTCGDPSYVRAIVRKESKPEPLTVTEFPTAPLLGFRIIAGKTVNTAVSPPAAESVTIML